MLLANPMYYKPYVDTCFWPALRTAVGEKMQGVICRRKENAGGNILQANPMCYSRRENAGGHMQEVKMQGVYAGGNEMLGGICFWPTLRTTVAEKMQGVYAGGAAQAKKPHNFHKLSVMTILHKTCHPASLRASSLTQGRESSLANTAKGCGATTTGV